MIKLYPKTNAKEITHDQPQSNQVCTEAETLPESAQRYAHEGHEEGLQVMPAPDYSWVADPDVITSAIQLLAAAVAGAAALLGAVLTLLGGVLAWIWNKTDSKIDRIATSLEALTLTTSTELATIKAKCEANHPS